MLLLFGAKMINFEVGQQILWEGNRWEIRFNEARTVMLKHLNTQQFIHTTLGKLEKAYMERTIAPTASSDETENLANKLNFSELSTRQQKIVLFRMHFVDRFMVGDVTIFNAKDIIREMVKDLEIEKGPGEASVRRWVTIFRKSGNEPISLVDNRLPLYR